MANPSPTTRRAPLDDTEEVIREEQVTDREGNNVVIIPADGHGWKKYGQKFIKNIRKTRSYFKCHKMNCGAKKRAEWSATNPKSIRIIYEGVHTHSSSITHEQGASGEEASSAATRVNQYDLYTQVFGDQNNSNS